MILEEGAIVLENVTAGDNVVIGYHSIVEADVTMGDNVRVSNLCNITKGAVIGNNVFIGPGVILTNTRKISYGRDLRYTGKLEPPVIEDGVRIGANATILAGVRLGEQCEIGAGAVVAHDTKPFCIYLGVPAKWVGRVPEEEWYPGTRPPQGWIHWI